MDTQVIPEDYVTQEMKDKMRERSQELQGKRTKYQPRQRNFGANLAKSTSVVSTSVKDLNTAAMPNGPLRAGSNVSIPLHQSRNAMMLSTDVGARQKNFQKKKFDGVVSSNVSTNLNSMVENGTLREGR